MRRDNRTYVVALLACGWPNNKTYKWSDTKQLMTYGLDHFEHHTIAEAYYDESKLKPIEVLNGQTDTLDTAAYAEIKIDRKPASDQEGLLLKTGEQIQVDLQIKKQLEAPVSAGTQVGTIKYLVNGEVYKVEYIFTTESINAINFPWCLKQILIHYCL